MDNIFSAPPGMSSVAAASPKNEHTSAAERDTAERVNVHAGHEQVVTGRSVQSREAAVRMLCAAGVPDEHQWRALLDVNPALARLRAQQDLRMVTQATISLGNRRSK